VVSAYLKNSGITTPIEQHGAGKMQPLRTCDEISGHNHQTKLIECLAPNRRVEIEVRGIAR
jgi:outer membrane protein OmpA-like peptidoglycan-associated protein